MASIAKITKIATIQNRDFQQKPNHTKFESNLQLEHVVSKVVGNLGRQ